MKKGLHAITVATVVCIAGYALFVISPTFSHAASAPIQDTTGTKYDYAVVAAYNPADYQSKLNAAGQNGFELVTHNLSEVHRKDGGYLTVFSAVLKRAK